MDITKNSLNYWNKRFSEDWVACSGDKQTQFFYSLVVHNLPEWIIDDINKYKYGLCDIGCAQGDGLPILARLFPNSKITGSDFSTVAIESGKKMYPQFEFQCENINNILNNYDIIFSSNTLEHFHNPFSIIKSLSMKANKYMILLLPFEEEVGLIDEHFSYFFYDNIPIQINDFRLVFYKEIDCTAIADSQYLGKQILLVYNNEINKQNDITIEKLNSGLINLKNLNSLNKKLEIELFNKNIAFDNLTREKEELLNHNQNLIKEREELLNYNQNLINEKDFMYQSYNYEIEKLTQKNNEIYKLYSDIVNSKTWIYSKKIIDIIKKIDCFNLLK